VKNWQQFKEDRKSTRVNDFLKECAKRNFLTLNGFISGMYKYLENSVSDGDFSMDDSLRLC
jgi:hypothetical protein